jgi:hypothetical protein
MYDEESQLVLDGWTGSVAACRSLPILVKICVFSIAVQTLRLAAQMFGGSSALNDT